MASAFPKPEKRGKKPKKRLPTKKVRQKKAKAKCLALWSKIIRAKGACVFIGKLVGRKWHERCSTPLNAMHCLPKGAYPALRLHLDNGMAGCGEVHMYYTKHPEEFGILLRQFWGPEKTEEMLALARTQIKIDYEAELVVLEEKAREHGL